MDKNENKVSTLPGPADVAAVLAFLPIFEKPGFKFGESCGGEKESDGSFTMPYFSLSARASRFVKALYDHKFILTSFVWTKWQNEAERYVTDPTAIESADLETICRLLTTHVRKDRFCEGHLAEMFDCGHLLNLMGRLRSTLGQE